MMQIPLTKSIKDCKDIVVGSDELIITFISDQGYVKKIISLPTMLHNAKLIRAIQEDNTLKLYFIPKIKNE